MNEDKIQAVYSIDLNQIDPNPYQPRHYFNPEALRELSESIRRFGVLQPIVVTRKEQPHDGGLVVRYEIIAGERRFRASKMAGLTKIPAVVRENEQSDQEKLELAILENLQREDLNPVDKARSFAQLVNEFGLKHAEVASHLGKSREYVSNSMRILALPEEILDGLSEGKISEGHTRPLLMLKDRPEEQKTLYQQIISGGMTVRAAEKIARGIAKEKQRKSTELDPEMKAIKTQLEETLGTRVKIDKHEKGGKLTIDFFSREDLKNLLAVVGTGSVSVVGLASESISSAQDSETDLYGQQIVAKEQQQKSEEDSRVQQNEEIHDLDLHTDGQNGLDALQDEINRLAAEGGGDNLEGHASRSDYSMNEQAHTDHFQVKKQSPSTGWSFREDTGTEFGESTENNSWTDQKQSRMGQNFLSQDSLKPNSEESAPISEADMISDTNAFAAYAKSQKQPVSLSEVDNMSIGDGFLAAKKDQEKGRKLNNRGVSQSDFMVGGDEFTI